MTPVICKLCGAALTQIADLIYCAEREVHAAKQVQLQNGQLTTAETFAEPGTYKCCVNAESR